MMPHQVTATNTEDKEKVVTATATATTTTTSTTQAGHDQEEDKQRYVWYNDLKWSSNKLQKGSVVGNSDLGGVEVKLHLTDETKISLAIPNLETLRQLINEVENAI